VTALLRPLLMGAGEALAGSIDSALTPGDDGPVITDITHDSRRVHAGSLFCCIRGAATDGHRFADDAVRAGAAALLCDHSLSTSVPEVRVPDTRRAMAPLAATFYGHPSRSMRVIGITGTNGKTTTVRLVQAILDHHGIATGVIGTLTGARTTPEAPELQEILAGMRDRGMQAVAMEVSSHGIALHRVDATSFAAVGFTNLSRDHLDFHGTMEEYFKAKAALFTPEFSPLAVIDVDTANGMLLAATTEIDRVVRTGVSTVEILAIDASGTRYRWRGVEVSLPLPGRFNVSNALVASELCVGLGVEPATVAEALAAVTPVPGRFQRVQIDAPFTVIVDYAHTPDGLDNVLAAAREIAGGARVLVAFGGGGDRDATKRPFMGRSAREGADYVVVTSDNPRSEDPARIAAQIVAGMPARPDVVELDRRRAIRSVLGAARAGDVVVIAGKGHETMQQIGDRSLPFDDAVVAVEEASTLRSAGQG
jgi:UDP-N-acetylmuramoyl-L-alanyl-D-glutamate--2,6-diaminopimelate ligase